MPWRRIIQKCPRSSTHDDPRQHEHVQGEEAPERRGADLLAAAQADEQEVADEGHRAGDVGADLGGPVGLLVPGEQIAGEAEPHGDPEQGHAGEPVQLARRLVGAGEEHAQHVHEHQQDHAAGGPVVDGADPPAELDVGADVDHALVGGVRRGLVVHREQDAGDGEDEEEHEGDPAEAVDVVGRVLGDDAVVLVLHRVVETDAVDHPADEPGLPAPGLGGRLARRGIHCGAHANSPLYQSG